MIRHFVVDISLVERCAIETSKLFALGIRCLRQALTCRIIFRRDVQLFDKRESLIVDRSMVTDHPLGEGTHILVLALVESLLARFYVDWVRRVGNTRDLGVCRLGGRRRDGAGKS